MENLPISSDLLAVNESHLSEATTLAIDTIEAMNHRDIKESSYRGVDDETNSHFGSNRVWRINKNEYFSFDDNLKYWLTGADKRIALINLKGILLGSPSWDEYGALSERIARAEKPEYCGVLIMADSPGGMTMGMKKLNRAIENYSKPIGAYVAGDLCSAAAYVTAPCDFIMADPDYKNRFGSIGVFSLLENLSERLARQKIKIKVVRNADAYKKFKPNPYEPLTPEDIKTVQDSVNATASNFHHIMQTQRRLNRSQLDRVKTGSTFDNAQAYQLGLHDGQGSFRNAIDKIAGFNSPLFV